MNGKAKILYQAHNPPIFQSTESGRFNLDTMTGFNKNIDDKSPTGIKPFLGGKRFEKK